MKKIYIGETKTVAGMILTKNSILSEDICNIINEKDKEISKKIISLEEYSKNKKKYSSQEKKIIVRGE